MSKIIREEIPTKEVFENILDTVKLPKSCKQMGLICDEITSFKATKDIRDKYVLSFLLWDLGVLDQLLIEEFN